MEYGLVLFTSYSAETTTDGAFGLPAFVAFLKDSAYLCIGLFIIILGVSKVMDPEQHPFHKNSEKRISTVNTEHNSEVHFIEKYNLCGL